MPKGQETVNSVMESAETCFKALLRTLDEQGPFDGILGYSEGATVAATVLLEEKKRFEEEGIPRTLKCAVFFAGWPPIRTGGGDPILVDTDGEVIDLPTVHVVGSQDPYLDGRCRRKRLLKRC